MSYLNTLTVQERLAESSLPGEMFGNPAQSHSAELRLETEQEEQDTSEYSDTNEYEYPKLCESDDNDSCRFYR